MTKTPITDRAAGLTGFVDATDMRHLETAAHGLREALMKAKTCVWHRVHTEQNLNYFQTLVEIDEELARFDALKEGK